MIGMIIGRDDTWFLAFFSKGGLWNGWHLFVRVLDLKCLVLLHGLRVGRLGRGYMGNCIFLGGRSGME